MDKKYISAGAGSGKTYTITTNVAKMVDNGLLKPDQIIMTTYTKAAAQELREKAKKELANLGKYREAQQMEHALIGTVHAVANTFLTKYWYLLGITPDAAAMEEDELTRYRDQSLRGLLSKEDRRFMYDFCERYEIQYLSTEHKAGLNYEFWTKDLCQVLDYMQWYSISDEQLDKSLATTESIIKCLEPRDESLQSVLTDDFYQEVEDFFGLKNELTDKQQATKDFYYSLRDIKTVDAKLAKKFNDKDHIKLVITVQKIKYVLSGPATDKVSAFINEAASFTAESANDLRKYAAIIFRLAKEWRKMYREYKDVHHLIDFNDMEVMFLKLLEMEEVQEDIKSRFTHLFVDEFQDSNPMQVNIFQRLSSLLNTCYVGDKKQAIYGFRGSDTDLTEAVADSIKEKEPLKHSYRSVESLVNFSNTIFTKIFSNMPPEEVKLEMPPTNGNTTSVDAPLQLWAWEKDAELALRIQQFILQEQQKPAEVRIEPKDIAVLARSNDELDKLADELRQLHVPVCRESNDIKESRTGRLVKALLTLVASPSNQLARAEVAYLTAAGYHVGKIIEDRIDHLNLEKEKNEYLMDLSILKRLDQLMKYHDPDDTETSLNIMGYQSISALLETLIIELDLYAMVQSWESASAEETNLQVFVDLAKKYEESATRLARPATINGFINYFCENEQKGAANEVGVRLFTYHKSKGLEWKVVIMLSLDDDVSQDTEIAKKSVQGCHYHRKDKPTPENTNPPMSISLVRNIYGKKKEVIDAVTARLQKHPYWNEIRLQAVSESARLLYVGVTRARNILILAAKGKKNDNTINLSWFRSVGFEDIVQVLPNDLDEMDIFKVGIPFRIEQLNPEEKLLEWLQKENKGTHDLVDSFSSLTHLRNIAPSKAGNTPHDINVLNQVTKRMEVVNKKEEEAQMGDFIHQVFCCMDDSITKERICELRSAYGFTEKNIPNPEELFEAWDFLINKLTSTYGKETKRHHEMPFRHLDDQGRMVSGYMDFIWETEKGYVIVDYKTCPGGYDLVFKPSSEHYAGRHGDQLDCYQHALEAKGDKPVLARVIYYPVTQYMAEIK